MLSSFYSLKFSFKHFISHGSTVSHDSRVAGIVWNGVSSLTDAARAGDGAVVDFFDAAMKAMKAMKAMQKAMQAKAGPAAPAMKAMKK